MTKIEFVTQNSKDYSLKATETLSVTGATFTAATGSATIEFANPTDKVTITLSANQVRISKITVYSEVSGVGYEFNSVAMRFQGALDVETYEALLAEGAEVNFGVVAARVSKLNGQTSLEAVEAEDENAKFFECNPEVNAEGDAYLFALLLTDVPAEEFAEVMYSLSELKGRISCCDKGNAQG